MLGPVSFMEHLFNFDFNGLRRGVYSLPLSTGFELDQVTVLDIAAMAVYAIEHPEEMIGRTIDIASERVSGGLRPSPTRTAKTTPRLFSSDMPARASRGTMIAGEPAR